MLKNQEAIINSQVQGCRVFTLLKYLDSCLEFINIFLKQLILVI